MTCHPSLSSSTIHWVEISSTPRPPEDRVDAALAALRARQEASRQHSNTTPPASSGQVERVEASPTNQTVGVLQ